MIEFRDLYTYGCMHLLNESNHRAVPIQDDCLCKASLPVQSQRGDGGDKRVMTNIDVRDVNE